MVVLAILLSILKTCFNLVAITGTVPDPFAGSLEASATAAPAAGLTDPDLGDNSDTAQIVAVESIFADDFESGGTTLWSSTVGLAP
jgi:hypothetical protein